MLEKNGKLLVWGYARGLQLADSSQQAEMKAEMTQWFHRKKDVFSVLILLPAKKKRMPE